MTTIAYRDGQLAADSGACVGDTRLGSTVKIARAPSGDLAGAAGGGSYKRMFLAWFVAGEQGDPPPARETEHSFDRGVVFRRDGTIEVWEASGRCDLRAPYYAFGSGRDLALGAMFAGGSAETAIRAAIEHDGFTHGRIDVLSHAEDPQ